MGDVKSRIRILVRLHSTRDLLIVNGILWVLAY